MITVDPRPLHSAAMTRYLTTADRRIIIGFRAALEALKVPVPEAALRRPSGRPTIINLVQAYNADNPVEAIRDNQERLGAGNEISKAQQAARSNGDILNNLDPSALLEGSDDNAR